MLMKSGLNLKVDAKITRFILVCYTGETSLNIWYVCFMLFPGFNGCGCWAGGGWAGSGHLIYDPAGVRAAPAGACEWTWTETGSAAGGGHHVWGSSIYTAAPQAHSGVIQKRSCKQCYLSILNSSLSSLPWKSFKLFYHFVFSALIRLRF